MAIVGGCCRRLLIIPSRANGKRILYWALVWTALCYLLLQVTNKEAAVTYLSGHVQRGLLQKAVVTEQNGLPAADSPRWTLAQRPMMNGLEDEPDIHVDRTPEIDEKQLLAQLANLTNIPKEYWSMDAKKREAMSTVTSCARFPSLYDIEFNNVYWQKMVTRNGSSFYLYGAYYDDRWRGGPTAQVRILGMVDRVKPLPTFCQLWFNPQQDKDGNKLKSPLMGQVTYTYGWVKQWGNYKDGVLQPFLISCRIPQKEAAGRIPVAVSLVEKQCDKQTTNLRVIYDKPFSEMNVSSLYPPPPNDATSWSSRNHTFYKTTSSPPGDVDIAKRGHFAVCVKGLDFLHEDLSVRLVEWLELLRILGAEKVFLYELEIHPNISKVLRHYRDEEKLVHLTPITLPGAQPNLPGLRHLYLKARLTAKRQNEVIPYNDCLYRNLYRYEYLALLDIDEIIMPKRNEGWRDLMEDVVKAAMVVRNYTRASYNFRNVYFLDDLQDGNELAHEAHEVGIPRYLHMLQHVYRSRNYTKAGSYVKCFHNTDRAVWLHNHFPLSCLGTCTTWSVEPDVAHMQHYRKDCVGPLKKLCSKDFRAFTTRDTTIWKYKNELVRKTNSVLSRLGFFG